MLRIMPRSTARPTTVDTKLFVTLNVMSTRAGSPHSATMYPLRMITPLASPRGLKGPTAPPNGSRPKDW